jgi:hypothetical protein
MNTFNKLLIIGFLATALLLPNMAQAMSFPQFDSMSNQDRQDYLDFMTDCAHQVLVDEGRTADADKMYHLFNDVAPGSVLSLGEGEFELNLANERVHAAQKMIDQPNAPPVQVGTAMLGTLMNNGIKITPDFVKSFQQLTSTFKPKHPPPSHTPETPAPPSAPAPATTNAVPSQPSAAPATTNAAPASTPAPNQNMTPDDNPVGEGGLITPYSPKK